MAFLSSMNVVGSGLHISEAVPCVFGILIASKGSTMDGIIGAVNIGSDTDTIGGFVFNIRYS